MFQLDWSQLTSINTIWEGSKVRFLRLISLLCFSPIAQATTIAVIDSGIDYKHFQLEGLIWQNQSETDLNQLDDDGNGFVDDIRGWNFANNHSRLIDYDDEVFFNADIISFLDIQNRSLTGEATVGEQKWAEARLKDASFSRDMANYLNYAHGTHVAGIMTRDIDDVKLIDIRVIPGKEMENVEANLKEELRIAIDQNEDIEFILEFIFKMGLKIYAKMSNKMFSNVVDYLIANDVKIANASIGYGLNQARAFVTPFLMIIGRGQTPSDTVINEYATFFLRQMRGAQQQAFSRANETLFIFAAGNDQQDNDVAPTLPASVKLANTLSVGASIGRDAIAPFSNYGSLSVDVFAPGVGINSIAPMDKTLMMSGTSQAAPMVTSLAVKILQQNPKLSPSEIKAIIMGTVDRKAYLRGKSYTEGLINEDRAFMAAKLSIDKPIVEAIAESKVQINNMSDNSFHKDINIQLIGKPFLPSFL
jgi:subtilisin family serine protease